MTGCDKISKQIHNEFGKLTCGKKYDGHLAKCPECNDNLDKKKESNT